MRGPGWYSREAARFRAVEEHLGDNGEGPLGVSVRGALPWSAVVDPPLPADQLPLLTMRPRSRRSDLRTDSPGRQPLCRHPQFPFTRRLPRRGLPLSGESEPQIHHSRASRLRRPVARTSRPLRLQCLPSFPVRLERWISGSMGIGLLPSETARKPNSGTFSANFLPQGFPPLWMEPLPKFHMPVERICGGFFTFRAAPSACRPWACWRLRPLRCGRASRCTGAVRHRRRGPLGDPCAAFPAHRPGSIE